MSLIIKLNSEPKFSYGNKAESYAILDGKNNILHKLSYSPCELKEGEKIICFFTQTLSLEQYLNWLEYTPGDFFEEISEDKITLSDDEKILFSEMKSTLLNIIVATYFQEMEEIKDADFKSIEIKLERINFKVSDLEKVNECVYKLKPEILTSLLSDLNIKDPSLLDNLQFTKKEIDEIYSNWADYMDEEYTTEKSFKIGYVYTYNQIKNCTLKDKEQDLYSMKNAYRYIDKKLVEIANNGGVFMNLAQCLTVNIDDKNIYRIHCSSECA